KNLRIKRQVFHVYNLKLKDTSINIMRPRFFKEFKDTIKIIYFQNSNHFFRPSSKSSCNNGYFLNN
ncbi:MAG TPA: hypothetical protein VET23_14520, partial [Chitinophagaceae bacterium]|nr:hypothetical protein [Chitinophagaceae bacterium]